MEVLYVRCYSALLEYITNELAFKQVKVHLASIVMLNDCSSLHA